MSDDIHLLSRRNALKGLGAFAGTSAIGAGTILHASEPAAAVDHIVSINDVTIETLDGAISVLGLSDMWFEVTYENVPEDLIARFWFRTDLFGVENLGSQFNTISLGVSGDGSETFGYGEKYIDDYDVHLAEDLDNNVNTPLATQDGDWLQAFSLGDDEDQTNVPVDFAITIYNSVPGEGTEQIGQTGAEFDVTVQRVETSGEAGEGEADPFGED